MENHTKCYFIYINRFIKFLKPNCAKKIFKKFTNSMSENKKIYYYNQLLNV